MSVTRSTATDFREIKFLPNESLDLIVGFSDESRDVVLEGICQVFRDSSERALRDEWAAFSMRRYPFTRRFIRQMGGMPRSLERLHAIHEAIRTATLRFPSVHRIPQVLSSFSPGIVVPVFEQCFRRENDRNLLLIMSRISTHHFPNADQVRSFLEGHRDDLANITTIDLENLGLLMIPEEFAQLYLPQLTHLSLQRNPIVEIPTPFLVGSLELKRVSLADTQLQRLPAKHPSNVEWDTTNTPFSEQEAARQPAQTRTLTPVAEQEAAKQSAQTNSPLRRIAWTGATKSP